MAPYLLINLVVTPVIFFSTLLLFYVLSFPIAIRYIIKNTHETEGPSLKMAKNSLPQSSLTLVKAD